MPAYVIADVTVTDAATMDEYRKHVPGTIAKYGERFLVRGGSHQPVEGDWKPNRLVVIEFPSMSRPDAGTTRRSTASRRRSDQGRADEPGVRRGGLA